jgi:hypothetical protein
VARDTARDLSGLAGELVALKADARHWLTAPEYTVLHLRSAAPSASPRSAPPRGRRARSLIEEQDQ